MGVGSANATHSSGCGWKGLGKGIQPRQHDVWSQAQRIGLGLRAIDPCYLKPIRFGSHDIEEEGYTTVLWQEWSSAVWRLTSS